MDDDAQQQPLCVQGDVAPAARDLLGNVLAARTAGFRGLHALAVDHPAVGLGSRPAPSRCMTTWWRMDSHTLASRKARK